MPEKDSQNLPRLGSAARPIPVRNLVRGETETVTVLQDGDETLYYDNDQQYTVSAEDLLSGIRNIKNNPPLAELWINEILYGNEEIWPEEDNDETGRLLREKSAVLCAADILEEILFAAEDEEDGLEESLAEAETVLQAWMEFGGELTGIREYPDVLLRYLTSRDDEDTIDLRSSERQETFAACLDELCRRGNLQAITKRGYCYYCGTRVYPQNWQAATEAFQAVYAKTGEAWAANTLGYIYYYGRVNGGVPEYREAFRWFSIGYAGGLYESTYKLGDMFAKGYGVVKNGRIARDLYEKVYLGSMKRFLAGSKTGKFADAAIRMGNCFRDGIDCRPDPEKAYGYYLQARLVLQMRMNAGVCFGDDSVKARLDETMEEIRKIYTDRAKTLRTQELFWLNWVLDREHPLCRMTWKTLKNGTISMTFTRAPGSPNSSDRILVTFPAGDYCGLVRRIRIQTGKNASLSVREEAKEIIFDDYDWIFGKNPGLEFQRFGKTVAVLRTEDFRYKPK